MRSIQYNSQRDNHSFGGRFKAWSQCFSTSTWMLICYWLKKPCTDIELQQYVSEVEVMVGGSGRIAKKVVAWAKWITGYTSLWWLVQQEGIKTYLSGLNGSIVFRENNGTWAEVLTALQHGPVIVATHGLPGIRGGHIVLIVDHDSDAWIVHDPFGDATTAYTVTDGSNRRYGKEWFRRFTENVTGIKGQIRIMYFQPNGAGK